MLKKIPDQEEVSIVLAGPFKPSEFEPEHLAMQGVLLPQERQSALPYRKVLSAGSGFTFDGITLFVASRKLNLETHDTSRSDRLRDIALGILHHADGTPDRACGINYEFFFSLPYEQSRDELMFRQAPVNEQWSGVLQHPTVRQLTISGQRRGKFPGENNVTLGSWRRSGSRVGIIITVNYHFPMPRNCAVKELPKCASKFLEEEWSPALAFARGAAEHVFAIGGIHG